MQFDFNSIKTEMKKRLSLLSSWQKTLYYGVYERIIDAISYVLSKFAYTAEFLYNESNWMLATRRESLMPKAKLLSYTPHRKVGAEGVVIISADSTFSNSYVYTGNSVPIPRWTQLANTDGTIFAYIKEALTYYQNQVGNLTASVKEGTVKNYTYIAQGNSNEIIPLYVNNIDDEEIQIFIVDENGVTLYEVNICGLNGIEDELFFINDLDNYYCKVENAYDFQSISIKFGDGIRNKKLESGDRVKIIYGATKGDEGNITSAGVLTVIQDTLEDGYGNTVTLHVTNREEISDGSDYETLESIKYNAPNLFQSGYRAGSIYDWKDIIESFSYIQKAIVWTPEDEGDDTAANINKVYSTAISTDGSGLTTSQVSQLSLDLKNYKSPTEIISWRDIKKIYILFDIEAVIYNQSFTIVDTIIYDTLYAVYGSLNTSFQTNVYESNYISTIDKIEEIKYHTTKAHYLEENVGISITDLVLMPSVVTGNNEDQILLVANTLRLWIHRKISGVWQDSIVLIGQDVDGTIVGHNGYTIVDEDINYATNTIDYNISTIVSDPSTYGIQNPGDDDENGYIISISYQMKDADGNQIGHIRLPSREFITDIKSIYILTEYEYE